MADRPLYHRYEAMQGRTRPLKTTRPDWRLGVLNRLAQRRTRHQRRALPCSRARQGPVAGHHLLARSSLGHLPVLDELLLHHLPPLHRSQTLPLRVTSGAQVSQCRQISSSRHLTNSPSPSSTSSRGSSSLSSIKCPSTFSVVSANATFFSFSVR